jgi:hypothetical protein
MNRMNMENLERNAIEQRSRIEHTAHELLESSTLSYNVRKHFGSISIIASVIGFLWVYIVGAVSFRPKL